MSTLGTARNLEQQKKRARELLRALHAHDAEALARLRAHHPRFAHARDDALRAALALHDAQLVIARELGHASWPKLKAALDAVTRPVERALSYYDDRAGGLLEMLRGGLPDAIDQARTWHPRLADAIDDAIRDAARAGTITHDDARLVYARQHGHADWGAFAAHLAALGDGTRTEPFLDVVEAGKRGDLTRVEALLRAHPDLARARGTNGNTLLNLAAALAPRRAPHGAPSNDRLAIPRLLLALGADPNVPNDRGWTPLHQAGYANDAELAALLLGAGARVDRSAHGEGGTPLAAALFWGHRETADLLAEWGVVPTNLRVAAGLGRVDLVARCFGPDGAITAAARAGRAFHRPHSGFPLWQPTDDAQEVLDEALVWAAKSGRTVVMPSLVAHGARVDADPYRGTPLIWAAYAGRLDAVAWLLDHGADVNQRATFGGPQHGEGVTALHLAAQNDRVDVVALLLARGADPTVRDALYGGTAAGWAEHDGAVHVLALLGERTV